MPASPRSVTPCLGLTKTEGIAYRKRIVFHQHQREAIELYAQGIKHIFLLPGTGSGKSLTYIVAASWTMSSSKERWYRNQGYREYIR